MTKYNNRSSFIVFLTILFTTYPLSSTAQFSEPEDPTATADSINPATQVLETQPEIEIEPGIDIKPESDALTTAQPMPASMGAELGSEQQPMVDQAPAAAAASTSAPESLEPEVPESLEPEVPESLEPEVTESLASQSVDPAGNNTVTNLTNAEQDATELNVEPAEPERQTLELLGHVLEPNQATVLDWEFEATFVDASAQVPVLVVNGAEPGPTLCLTAAVHGDELNGIEVVRRVIHSADPAKLSGALIGVPIVNLQGFQRANRYLPDRRDLNRYFPGRIKGSYASRIAYSFFTQIVQHCDFLVDIHTGSLSRTNLPQIRANLLVPEIAALAEKMGSIVVLQSKGGSGTLRRAAAEYGIPSVTLEAGAPNNLQKEAVESGVKSVLNAMDSLGMTAPTPQPFWKRSEEPIFYQSTWIRARKGGILFSKVELGDTVRKGNVLGLLSDPITNKTTKIIAPFDGRVIGMALNQVMYQGFAAYHIGLKSSMVEAAQPPELIIEEPVLDGSTELPTANDTTETPTDAANIEAAMEPDLDDEAEAPINPIQEMELPTADEDD